MQGFRREPTPRSTGHHGRSNTTLLRLVPAERDRHPPGIDGITPQAGPLEQICPRGVLSKPRRLPCQGGAGASGITPSPSCDGSWPRLRPRRDLGAVPVPPRLRRHPVAVTDDRTDFQVSSSLEFDRSRHGRRGGTAVRTASWRDSESSLERDTQSRHTAEHCTGSALDARAGGDRNGCTERPHHVPAPSFRITARAILESPRTLGAARWGETTLR